MNKPTLQPEEIRKFRRQVYRYFADHGRILPWRTGYDPYHILISEVMLQQTQVDRVIVKYTAFINRFPDIVTLAAASLDTVLAHWQGLGYNRRAIALREAAKIIVHDFGGVVPKEPAKLMMLPGIGPATAASIAAFAYNKPTLFLETNIRTVLIHHFFSDGAVIDDKALLPIADAVLDRRNPRKWYSALMDYGTMLKKTVGNLTRNSMTYKKQSAFIGSRRQVRGAILRLLLEQGAGSGSGIARKLKKEKEVVAALLTTLTDEGLLNKEGSRYRIAR